jgi:hypothetical protein
MDYFQFWLKSVSNITLYTYYVRLCSHRDRNSSISHVPDRNVTQISFPLPTSIILSFQLYYTKGSERAIIVTLCVRFLTYFVLKVRGETFQYVCRH